jgi:hypothetical protein
MATLVICEELTISLTDPGQLYPDQKIRFGLHPFRIMASGEALFLTMILVLERKKLIIGLLEKQVVILWPLSANLI